jgi:hypothetical protein
MSFAAGFVCGMLYVIACLVLCLALFRDDS